MEILLALLCGFTISLIITSRRLHLYTPTRLSGFLHEQRLSTQACFTSGLLLTGTLYLVHAEDIPRTIVLTTLGMVTIALSLRRLVYRILIFRRFERGVGTRNVLIVGTGPEAHALRHHLESKLIVPNRAAGSALPFQRVVSFKTLQSCVGGSPLQQSRPENRTIAREFEDCLVTRV